MDTKLKILLAIILLTSVFSRDKICRHLGFGQARAHGNHIAISKAPELPEKPETASGDYFTGDALYSWEEQLLDWIPVPPKEMPAFQAQFISNNKTKPLAAEPIELSWNVLVNINYKLRYFSELDMKIYAPVFPGPVKALDGKEVIIEGFVIPFEDEVLSLSANPYASCFFCGKASPASVMSLYLKKKRKRYKTDDFKKFRGTLHLNLDDPSEYYYILRNASEE